MKLILKNFMKHSALEVDFQKGINWIDGPNGSGKSCIIDALRFVLGFESRNYEQHQEKLIKLGQKSCKVTLEDCGYTITRSKSKSSHTLKITNESKMYQSDALSDIIPVAEEIFNMPYRILRLVMKPFPFKDLEDRKMVLQELIVKLDDKVISDELIKQTKLDAKSAAYCAVKIKATGFDALIKEISVQRVNINREIIELDKQISSLTAVMEEKKKTSDSIKADLDFQEKELKIIEDRLEALKGLKSKKDAFEAKYQEVERERAGLSVQLQELVDNVEKQWIPDDLPVIKCSVEVDPLATHPVLRVGLESVVTSKTVDIAILPDTSQWDDGPLSTARDELGEKIGNLDKELKRLTVEFENGDDNTKEKSNAGNTSGDIIFSSQLFDSLGARSSVLRGGIEALRRQLAQKNNGSKPSGSGENVPAQSGQTLPGSSVTPLNNQDAGSQAAVPTADSSMDNEIASMQGRMEELKRNRAVKSASYDKYDLLIQGLGAKGSVQKALADQTISVLNESLAKTSQVSYEGIPALPMIKIDQEGNVDSEGVMSELRSVGERLIDCAQLAYSISLNMRIKTDVCSRAFILDEINDLDKSRKESLLAWITLLGDDFHHIVLATCGAVRPSAPDGLIKFIGLR